MTATAGILQKTDPTGDEIRNGSRAKDATEFHASNSQSIDQLINDALSADASVRQAAAQNSAVPTAALLVLCNDPDAKVMDAALRQLRARGVGLAGGEQRAASIFFQGLQDILYGGARNARLSLLEIVIGLPNVPRTLMVSLARDTDERISCLALKFAMNLDDDDILGILSYQSSEQRFIAVADRQNLTARLCDAVASSNSDAAIAALLSNTTAQIREETLDRIIESAAGKTMWHRPLATHPRLSSRLGLKLAHFIAEDLVEVLIRHANFDREFANQVSIIVRERFPADPTQRPERPSPFDPALVNLAHGRIEALEAKGSLSEREILGMFTNGITNAGVAALMVRTGLTLAEVERALTSGLPINIAAVCWQANISAVGAEQIQIKCPSITPQSIICADLAGWYALSESTMTAALASIRRDVHAQSEKGRQA